MLDEKTIRKLALVKPRVIYFSFIFLLAPDVLPNNLINDIFDKGGTTLSIAYDLTALAIQIWYLAVIIYIYQKQAINISIFIQIMLAILLVIALITIPDIRYSPVLYLMEFFDSDTNTNINQLLLFIFWSSFITLLFSLIINWKAAHVLIRSKYENLIPQMDMAEAFFQLLLLPVFIYWVHKRLIELKNENE